jgi:VanZ family protein
LHTLVFFCYTVLVAVLSLRPAGGPGIEHLDKLTHLLAYYIFAVLGYRMLNGGRYYLPLCLGIIAYGGLIEVAQSYMPTRLMSGYDLVANTVGVVLGAWVVKRRSR